MDKFQYLKYAIDKQCFKHMSWIISAFATVKESSVPPKDPYPGMLVSTAWGGKAFYDDDMKEIPIEDSKDMPVLYKFLDPIQVDTTWAINVSAPTQTTIGNLLVNHLAIIHAFGSKMPFVTGTISISKIEQQIAPKLQDTPLEGAVRSTEFYYVDEYIKFVDGMKFIAGLASIASWSATRKNITAPPGIKEFKKQLVLKYGDSLNDPIELAKFEKELADFDDKYLQGDVSLGKFASGKIKNVARKKMFLCLGAEKDFNDKMSSTTVLNSLEEGWSTDPKQFTAMMNNSRAASYSRGAETVKGGVSAKVLLRATNNFRILDTDCGSKLGIKRTYRTSNVEQLVGLYLADGKNTLIKNKEIAINYLNKELVLRSPMYCKLPGNTLCKKCVGEKLGAYEDSMAIPMTEISNIILYDFMGAMHAQVLATTKMNINELFS